jgi:type II secretory pathway component GspD/PulD (secretin)
MIKRIPVMLVCLQCCALAQTEPSAPPQSAPENPPVAAPQTSPGNADRSSDSVVDEIERLLREKENAEAAAAAQMEPSKPRTHRYTNQPISRVLRILAEQANINYIEPNFPTEERISVTLSNLTPLEAFYQIAESRGFQVIADGKKYTLRRADIESPGYYITRRYKIRNTPAEFLLQPIANYLGIKTNPAGDHFPAYPKPATSTNQTTDVASPLGGTGSDQSRARYLAGLPFDTPLSTGGFAKEGQNAVFVERSSNSLIVRATEEDQTMVANAIDSLDRKENQILLKTYVLEITDRNNLNGGLDWSQTLGVNGAKFTLTGKVGATGITGNIPVGSFFSNGLVLNFPDVAVVLRALGERGRIRSNNSPMTVAKSGMPVTIRSDTKQTIFLQTPGTNNYGPSTTPYTFTTGLTIDVIARILDDNLVDLNINPALSTVTSTSDAAPGTTTQVPVISTRSTTANVTVRSGQAAVIGGILRDDSALTTNGVPGLHKIPLLGYLFKSRQDNNTRTNLIVIVSPTIISADNRRRDRLGESEREALLNSSDLPGESPPLPLGESAKQVRNLSKPKTH